MGKEKEHLPLHVDRDSSPPLFKALDRLEGGSKELRQLLLGLPQIGSDARKFALVHLDGLLVRRLPGPLRFSQSCRWEGIVQDPNTFQVPFQRV
jgi:hypothetical protein